MRRVVMVMLILFSAMGVVIASGQQDSADDAGKYTVGFSCKTITNDDFLKSMAEAAQSYVESTGNKFILSVGGDQDSVSAQVNGIEDMIIMGIDALLLAPPDKNAFIPVMHELKDANIPVIILDSGVDCSDDLYVTYVGTDNVASAEVAGQMMIDAIGAGDTFIVLGSSGSDSSEDRAEGYKKAIKGSNVVVVNEQNGNWVTDTAMTVTENMLQANPNVKGIFTCSDVMYPGIISAVESIGKKGDIVIIGHDGFKLTVDAIKEGAMYGTVMQQPNVIGELGAKYAIEVLDGTFDESIGKFVDAKAIAMTAENVEELKSHTF